MKPVKVKALGDLKVVKRAIAEQARQRELQASQQVKAVKQSASDKDLFIRAAGAVKAPARQAQGCTTRQSRKFRRPCNTSAMKKRF